ncbi:hypothetical protein [Castellaniella sp. MT123]|uniref:hypothetical protein n=1 Tax=Castellaniella sp. MT123 TaxID=3140381 RepID=UPI0031F3B9E2
MLTAVASEAALIDAATDEEIAAWLSKQEGRPVTVAEVRRVVAGAMHRVRRELLMRGFTPDDLIPDAPRGRFNP